MSNLFILIDQISRRNKIFLLISLDTIFNFVSSWLSFFILLDHTHQIESFIYDPSNNQKLIFIFFLLLYFCVFIFYKVYKSITKYVNLNAIIQIGISIATILVIAFFLIVYLEPYGVPRSIAIVQPLLFFLFIISYRIAIRSIYTQIGANKSEQILIYGAGDAGLQFYNSIAQKNNYKVAAFIDDDKRKQGLKIDNINIIAPIDVKKYVEKNSISLILVCIPSIDIYNRRRIVNFLSKIRVKIKVLPGIDSLINGQIIYENFLDVGLDEVLERNSKIQLEVIQQDLKNSVVLITGSGGSIGSEISKQVLSFAPKKIILIDNSEFNLYNTANSLESIKKFQKLNTKIVSKLSDVKSSKRLEYIFRDNRPEIVFHAAAYKHLPIVEENIIESVQNNIFGTKNMIENTIKFKVKKFILISTDKAVRASSVMGMTKRFSEMLVQAYSEKARLNGTILSMVRFGNVLNSSGSIIPLFRKQINEGGPITITHPEVTRYFMTIPEAVSLVLYSMFISKGGEVFVLKMGKPIKILDIAKKMISLSGLRERSEKFPDGDIEIQFIGLRKGEKIHEELLFEEKNMNLDTDINEKPILVEKESFVPIDELDNILSNINNLININNDKEIVNILREKISPVTASKTEEATL